MAQYSAAVIVDLHHSMSLEENTQDRSKKVERTTANVTAMLSARVKVQNCVSNIQEWNTEANAIGKEEEYGCYNLVGHRHPEMFDSIRKWRDHCVECYGHDRAKEGWRKKKPTS